MQLGRFFKTFAIHLVTTDTLVQVTRPSLIGGEVTEDHQKQAEVTKHSSVEAQLKDRLILLR